MAGGRRWVGQRWPAAAGGEAPRATPYPRQPRRAAVPRRVEEARVATIRADGAAHPWGAERVAPGRAEGVTPRGRRGRAHPGREAQVVTPAAGGGGRRRGSARSGICRRRSGGCGGGVACATSPASATAPPGGDAPPGRGVGQRGTASPPYDAPPHRHLLLLLPRRGSSGSRQRALRRAAMALAGGAPLLQRVLHDERARGEVLAAEARNRRVAPRKGRHLDKPKPPFGGGAASGAPPGARAACGAPRERHIQYPPKAAEGVAQRRLIHFWVEVAHKEHSTAAAATAKATGPAAWAARAIATHPARSTPTTPTTSRGGHPDRSPRQAHQVQHPCRVGRVFGCVKFTKGVAVVPPRNAVPRQVHMLDRRHLGAQLGEEGFCRRRCVAETPNVDRRFGLPVRGVGVAPTRGGRGRGGGRRRGS